MNLISIFTCGLVLSSLSILVTIIISLLYMEHIILCMGLWIIYNVSESINIHIEFVVPITNNPLNTISLPYVNDTTQAPNLMLNSNVP